MNKIIIKNRNLLERFSSSLIGRGKKNGGYKTLLDSFFLLRQTYKKVPHYSPLPEIKLPDTALKDKSESTFGVPSKSKIREKVEKNKAKTKTKGGDKQDRTIRLEQSRDANKIENRESRLVPEKTALSNLLNKSICRTCVDNVKPILETRKVRKGRVTYQVPLVTQRRRQEGKAIIFLIESSKKKKGFPLRKDNDTKRYLKKEGNIALTALKKQKHRFLNFLFENGNLNESLGVNLSKKLKRNSLKDYLSEELHDSFFKKGGSVDKKKQLHQLALQNRAYTHYGWW